MAVELGHAELLKEWFTPVRDGEAGTDIADRLSLKADIERVGELLSELWFSADYAWTGWSAGDVLAVLQQWLPPDSAEEVAFLQCAVPGKLAELVVWLEPAIGRWAAQEEQATAGRGIENSEYERDPIAGTRYYRWVGGEYLYADDPDEPYVPEGAGWLSLAARIAAQDPAGPHYDSGTDRWRRPADGGGFEYQDRADRVWERTDGSSWLRRHSDAAGWLPYDKVSALWFYRDQWRDGRDVAALAAARVIPIHQIPGWESLEGEPWARDWYARQSPDGYRYLYSPGAIPTAASEGWDDVPPAPPADRLPDEPSALPARVQALQGLFEAVPQARTLSPRQLHDAITRAGRNDS